LELTTIGYRWHPGRKVFLWCSPKEEFDIHAGTEERLRLILLENGTGIVRINDQRISLIAPSILCISEKEKVTLEYSINFEARTIFFHPKVINGILNLDNYQNKNKELPLTCMQDSCWLKPFWKKDMDYNGCLNVGPGTFQRILKLFDQMSNELNEQPDGYWPCKSRSYLLEILFILERIYTSPESRYKLILDEPAEEVEKILLYLNTNYDRKITISELCKEFHINRTTLQENFIRTTGYPVMTYLIKLRLQLASIILKDTTVPATEVMERTGFSDITHFGKMFKKYLGCAPTEYRQQCRSTK